MATLASGRAAVQSLLMVEPGASGTIPKGEGAVVGGGQIDVLGACPVGDRVDTLLRGARPHGFQQPILASTTP